MSRKKGRGHNPFADYSEGVSAEDQAQFDLLHPLIAQDTAHHLAQADHGDDLPEPMQAREVEAYSPESNERDDSAPSTMEPRMAQEEEAEAPPEMAPPPRARGARRPRRPALPVDLPPPSQESSPSAYPWVSHAAPMPEMRRTEYPMVHHDYDPRASAVTHETIEMDETFQSHMDCLCAAYGMDLLAMLKTLAADRIRHDLKTGFILPTKLSAETRRYHEED